MGDKSNILSGLAIARPSNKENLASKQEQANSRLTGSGGGSRSTSGASSRQHKLKQRFTVIRKLGKGTYGKVQLAINKETGQEVAIKTIKKTKIENEQDLQRVRREIQIMSSIEHPHIIHIYEVFENKDKIVLVMQYAPGGELYEYVSQSKVLDDSEARRLFRQIATAIYYCHQNKICHRDLKLENILLDEKNNAKLADFGLSNVFDKRRQLKTFCGSPLYASPEIVQGSPYEGPEVDCWSLGVLLYTLVYGAMPFDGSNFKRLVKQISEACYFEPKQRSQASPLIRRLLCADPSQRATVLDICSDPWVNGQGAVPVSPRELQAYPSLVQVAQDMANLTPVRLDLLLALAPSSPVIAQPADSGRPPLGPRAENAPPRRSPVHIGPTLMELDETRASSPVASYIVRDLEEEVGAPLETEEATDERMDQDELEGERHEEEEEEGEQLTDSAELSVVTEPQQVHVESDQVEPPEEVEYSMSTGQLEPEADQPELEPELEPKPEPVVEAAIEPTAMEVDAQQEVESQPPCAPEPPASSQQVEGGTEPATTSEPADADKPKKVKKKIVVVRKRKRVAKKEAPGEAGAEPETKDKSKSDKGEEVESSGSTERPKPAVKSKGPGKVRIPNTFQSAEGNSQTPPPPKAPEARRQSTLVADVSQKLLQQLQQSATDNNKSEQVPVQLPGARVSDKKSEFERRASLAVVASSAGSASPNPPEEDTSEPVPAECLRESLSILDQVLQSLVEPVSKEGPLEVALLRPPENLLEGDPLTPTGESPARASSQREMEQKLVEKLVDGKEEPKSDERSDSVETIKADELNLEDSAKVRSSLVVDLAPAAKQDQVSTPPARQSRDSVSSLGSQLAVGPAPITRSYKKVTFTRDGACITETGKIYATQQDDGSVRRIERKSKITHYPATGERPGSQSAAVREETQEEEERVVYAGDQTGVRGERMWRESQSSFGGSKQVAGRPFEKLIMPSMGLLSERDDDFRRHSLFSRQSGPLGRADSGSSCSSSSTDVFDDIFDTWTGAISMFNKNLGRTSAASGLLSRAFEELALPPQSVFSSRKAGRRKGVSSSLAGTPRCESVEPQRRGECGQPGRSGYESDSRERPASASFGRPESREGLFAPLGKPRLSEDRSLFDDDFGPSFGCGNQLLRTIEQEHESLRQRLAREHRQLWKGSTPSLFQAEPQSDGWRQEISGDGVNQLRTSARVITNALEDQTLGQSQSSSSFLRQSVALDASPQRKSTAEHCLPPQPVRKSVSKTSVITTQLANVQISSDKQPAARFIELKRTSSSSSNHLLEQTLSQQQQQVVSSSSRLVNSASGSSSAFWEGRITPLGSTTSELSRQPGEPARTARDQADARVQDWLQESAGNLSSLSGSHSSASASASDSLNASRADPFSNLYGSLQSRREVAASLQNRQHSATLLPPIGAGPVRSSSRGSQTSESSTAAKQRQVKSSVVISTSHRLANSVSGAKLEQQQQQRQQIIHCESNGPDLMEQLSSSNQVVSTSYSVRLNSPTDQTQVKQVVQNQQHRQVSATSSVHSTSRPSSAVISGRNLDGLNWMQSAVCDTQVLAEENEDAFSGPGSAELDSSSSLLDQLRSRGYRSMINQRLVAQPEEAQPQLLQQQVASTRAESSSRIITSSSSSISGTTRLVQQKQVFTSSSSAHESSSASNLEQQELPAVPESSSVNDAATTVVNDQSPAEAVQSQNPELQNERDAKQVNEEEEEEMDEDVRQAKANIKCYLDSVKETENFLKSLQQEEENLERQRQQLYLFDNLIFGAKLNGISRDTCSNQTSLLDDTSYASSVTHNGGALSAPVRTSLKLGEKVNGFLPSAALSFEPTYTIPSNASSFSQYSPRQRPFEAAQFTPELATATSTYTPSYLDSWRSGLHSAGTCYVDPLEPVQAIGGMQHHVPYGRTSLTTTSNERPLGRFGRSRSQLGDQFSDYSKRRRPLSANLDSLGEPNPYFPSSAKRASSQMRYPVHQPLNSSRYSATGPAMSEYRSAYSGHHPEPRLPSPTGVSPTRGDPEESDDEMSSYRATNYVPRVVPQMQERGRTPGSRRAGVAARKPDWRASSPIARERRTSLQPAPVSRANADPSDRSKDEASPSTPRRSSVGEAASSEVGANSRLSQLELRIQQNRKRREQLLSGKLSPQPQSEESCVEARPQNSRELSPLPTSRGSSGSMTLSRPSRLESMEARIKRRSYCVRMADCSPERTHLRGQQSLEKWRPGSSSKRSSLTSDSTDLFQISTAKSKDSTAESGESLGATNGLD